MKYSSPKIYAVFIALLLALINAIFILLHIFIDGSNEILLLIVSVLSTFLVAYVPVYYILNNFIIGRIKPIFDTINNIKIPTKELYKNIEDKDIIKEVNTEVIDWAKSRTREIIQLKANEKYRKEFLGNVSHELKTPIFNIQGYIHTLLDGGLEDETINMKYLNYADKNIERLISIVQDLETITKLESGELKLKFKVFNITTLTLEVLEHHEIMANQANIRLKLTNDSDKSIMVYADKKKISQILINLITNSIKYGKQGGMTQVRITPIDEKVRIEVIDDGIGMEKEHLKRIFERFYRIDKSRSREQGGTGLGLSIVKHIIEGHNQQISVSSEVNKGTRFSFTLDSAFL